MVTRKCHPRIRAAVARLGLSDRQREIVEALALGMRHDAIAQMLRISRSTLRSHFRHIFTAVHVGNRVELLSLVLREVVKDARETDLRVSGLEAPGGPPGVRSGDGVHRPD
jgi:DNA-binding NarL/FixJ family response regulator